VKRSCVEDGFGSLAGAKVYRHLLKAVKRHIGKEETKKHFAEYVTEEFRKNCVLSDPSSIQQKIKLAKDYTYLLNSVHHHMVLLSLCHIRFAPYFELLFGESDWMLSCLHYLCREKGKGDLKFFTLTVNATFFQPTTPLFVSFSHSL